MSFDSADLIQVLTDLRSSETPLAWLTPDGRPAAPVSPAGILPGSFNPLHAGHVALRAAAAEFLCGPVCFELTVRNADKPPLQAAAIVERLRQFPADAGVLAVTNAPTFAEKARLFGGVTFVVGFDTAERILQVRFYEGRPRIMAAALDGVRRAGCRFLVAGRATAGPFATLRNLDVPAEFADLFVELPEQRFRADVSSTELRET